MSQGARPNTGPDRGDGGHRLVLPQALLLTGPPGSGKTTLIRHVVERPGRTAGGFYTTELREQGRRVGFELITLAGERVLLAHVSCRSPYRVGRYGVDLDALERVGVAALRRASSLGQLVVVDEIGKMEMGSALFRDAVLEVLEGGGRLLGTILQASHPWADRLKQDRRVRMLLVTRGTWDAVCQEVLTWLGAALGSRPKGKG